MVRKIIVFFGLGLMWALVIYVLIFVDPEILKDIFVDSSYLPFFGLLFFTLWYTFSLLIKSIKIGFTLSILIILLLVLSMLRILTVLSGVILVAFLSTIFYSGLKNRNKID